METGTKVCFLLVYSLMSRQCSSASAPCSHFHFPTVNGSHLTVKENSTVTLPFTIDQGNCKISDNFSLKVSKFSGSALTQCWLTHSDGKCVPSVQRQKCTCASDKGVYLFTDVFDRSDNTTWVWSTDDHSVAKANLTFNVLYPARVTSLLVVPYEHENTALPNTSVEIVCSWDEGNPPVTARLLDRHGVEMEGSIYSSGQIRYTFPAVGCQDAGLIRCEAPGASHNKTATLLVKCAPQIQINSSTDFSAPVGSRFALEFQLRSHTSEITECKLKSEAVMQTVVITTVNCSGLMKVTGTPPDLVLTVLVAKVRKRDEGQWTLTLTSNAGAGHLDFYFHVTDPTGFTHVASSSKTLSPVATSSKEPRDTKEPSSVVMYVATIIAVVLVVGIISLSVTVICVKRATRTSAVPVLRQEIQLVERPRHPLPRHSAGSNESIHTYEEVRARPFQRFLSLAAAFRPASRRCQAPSNDPEDYLHPVPDSGAPPQSSAVNEQFL